jgi:hypothetical protein
VSIDTWSDDPSQYDDDAMLRVNPGEINPTITYVTTDEAVEEVGAELASRVWDAGTTEDGRPIRDELAAVMDQWTRNVNSQTSMASETLFFRNRYVMTSNVFDQMMQCADAVEHDEVLGAVADTTEGLAFQRIALECADPDQQDVWNQICTQLRLQRRVREIWRELFKSSQAYVGIWWDKKTFTVRTPPTGIVVPEDGDSISTWPANTPVDTQLGPVHNDMGPDGTPGGQQSPKQKRKRRKQYTGIVPTALTLFDPTKVMPVGTLLFGKERFAYLANEVEHEAFCAVFNGDLYDDMAMRMLEGHYVPTPKEMNLLNKQHKSVRSLWLFRPDAIVRLHLTKSHYERFSPVRLKSILPLLEMKQHLRASDRATLIGATNFIIVLKRGSDKLPARSGEIDQLREQARVIARMPILVGDHRLAVEIVTPSLDHTLDGQRYNTLDERIIMRALGTFRMGGVQAGRSDNPANTDAVIVHNIESRRNQIAEDLELDLFKLILDKNGDNEKFLTEAPNITFHPRRVNLGTDANLINAILQVRDRGDISRETMLEELDYNQEVEYLRRKREKPMDDVFQSSVPFSSPGSNPFSNGAQGGRPTNTGAGDIAPPSAPKPTGPTGTPDSAG